MRRLIPATAAVLLATACSSGATTHATSTPASTAAPSSPATSSAAPSPSQSSSPTSSSTSPSSVAAGQLAVAIPVGQLPYKAAAGAPALGDVTISKTGDDPCGIPSDDSGNEAQLLDAEKVGPVLVVTFEFSNPCANSLSYDITVTQAIGSETGPTGGPALQTTTPTIGPGQSISFKVNVDPKATLTPTQLQQLWVGVTRIGKHRAG